MKIIKKSAIFSPCNQYRYSLSRVWNLSQKPALIIGLNPSTADEKKDDLSTSAAPSLVPAARLAENTRSLKEPLLGRPMWSTSPLLPT